MNPITPFHRANLPAKPSSAKQPQFGAALPGMANNPIGRGLKAFDFKELGGAHLKLIMLTYAVVIQSRIYTAWRRSKNDLRENVIRGPFGYFFWLFGTPLVQRAVLLCAPKTYKNALIQVTDTPPNTKGLWGKLRLYNWKFNPLSRWEIPSSKQIAEQAQQALSALEQSGQRYIKQGGKQLETEAYQKLRHYYLNGLFKWRNLATAVGWGFTLAVLGLGINTYNILSTRARAAQGQVGR